MGGWVGGWVGGKAAERVMCSRALNCDNIALYAVDCFGAFCVMVYVGLCTDDSTTLASSSIGCCRF